MRNEQKLPIKNRHILPGIWQLHGFRNRVKRDARWTGKASAVGGSHGQNYVFRTEGVKILVPSVGPRIDQRLG